MKFNAYDSVVASAGYDQSVRAWDCRSQSTEPIQVNFLAVLHSYFVFHFMFCMFGELKENMLAMFCFCTKYCICLSQIIDTFQDSVMSVCLTKTEIIAGSVDGTVRTFDIRIGR